MDTFEIENDLYFDSVLMGLISVYMTTLLILLTIKQNSQPLKKRSPQLIIISVVGNLMFSVILLIQEISRQVC
jgi:hypothetical protein